ncbi:ADP-ribosyltransferase [Nocardia sp. SYP-A9097]|uniref:ADP-ribosyltransferase n=1 Tax=Nocardia sp. SYP-A9097 TaxID=2663237 RepID=UPI00189163A7|nr:ADP-ribosyltransferase [Nocardia sp. SYP-A9097]
MVDADNEDDAFQTTRLADTALTSQDHSLLTSEESGAIRAYAYNYFEQINAALWDGGERSPLVARYIDLIRSGLAKYPLPEPVRVTREAVAADFDIFDEGSADALVEEEIRHRGFMSTCGLAYPPRSIRHRPAVIVDLIVPTGTPALRLGDLATVKEEREVLLIDARSYFISGVDWG